MLEFISKIDCTGCAACMNVCPVSSISMNTDKEGFLYPDADERCIDCKKCEAICPVVNEKVSKKPNINQYAVAALTSDIDIWNRSTSGGAFVEICKAFGDNDTVIFGARFDNLNVIHTYVIGSESSNVFSKSKYVQSEMGYCYKETENFLMDGKKVIFSGTPCQIAGLMSFLGAEYSNLLCVDLICHGVGSPGVFKDTLKMISTKYSSRVKEYTFRFKKVWNGNYKEYLSRYVFENERIEFVELDEYNQLFISQLCTRGSCQNNCKFRNTNRISDITLGDFKNRRDVFPEIKDYQNYSTIVVNSAKGDSVFNKLKSRMKIYSCSLSDIKKNNPLFYRSISNNPKRNQFFCDYSSKMEINELVSKYCTKVSKRRFGRFKDLLPYRLKRFLLSCLQRK